METNNKENAPEEKKIKKKRGFVGWLWLLFKIVLFFLVLFSLILYWKFYLLLGYGLNGYAYCLSNSLTSSGNYQWEVDVQGPEYEKATPEQRQIIIQTKQQDIYQIFDNFVKKYKEAPGEHWDSILIKISEKITEIYQDAKISPDELESFCTMIEQITENPPIQIEESESDLEEPMSEEEPE
ncbi:MAG TPA: hypothetical protein P5543_00395 [Planctomycetota bacterium]|nr:hypothetical protein [Planctomycetota bacterium]HRU50640.1 hypothetical protein [Planctomycetota bacterium]